MEVIPEATEVMVVFMEAIEVIMQVHDLHLEAVLGVESEVEVVEAAEEVVEAFVEVLHVGELVSNSCNKSSHTFVVMLNKEVRQGKTELCRRRTLCALRIQKNTRVFSICNLLCVSCSGSKNQRAPHRHYC